MKNLTCLAVAAILALSIQPCLAAPPASAPAPAPAAPVTQLPGATVEGQATVIDRSDRHLHQLQNSLPELGGERPHHRKPAERLREYLARHRDPNQATGQQRAMMERAKNPP